MTHQCVYCGKPYSRVQTQTSVWAIVPSCDCLLSRLSAHMEAMEARVREMEAALKRAYDELWGHRNPVEAYARQQTEAGKTCHTCIHFISRCDYPNADRVNCKIAEGWPHWTGCSKHEPIPEAPHE